MSNKEIGWIIEAIDIGHIIDYIIDNPEIITDAYKALLTSEQTTFLAQIGASRDED